MPKWGYSEITTFLDIYQNYATLWNINLKDYKIRRNRDRAWNQLYEDLRSHRIRVRNLDELKNKVKSLRGAYTQEVNKILKTKNNYVPKLAWFEQADSFWRSSTIPRGGGKISKTITVTCDVVKDESSNPLPEESVVEDYEGDAFESISYLDVVDDDGSYLCENISISPINCKMEDEEDYLPRSSKNSSNTYDEKTEDRSQSKRRKVSKDRSYLLEEKATVALEFAKKFADRSETTKEQEPKIHFGNYVNEQINLIKNRTIREDTKWAIQVALRRGLVRDTELEASQSNQETPQKFMPQSNTLDGYFKRILYSRREC